MIGNINANALFNSNQINTGDAQFLKMSVAQSLR
jgi:hypothetical protein